jgi:hypothetical protein
LAAHAGSVSENAATRLQCSEQKNGFQNNNLRLLPSQHPRKEKMNVSELKASLENAFDAHASALNGGNEKKISQAWNAYAKAKNAYLEAYHGGQD